MELQIKSNSGLMKNSEALMRANLMNYLMVTIMTFLWTFESFFYLVSLMVLLKILMASLMVPMMKFLWFHKWKLYLTSLTVLMEANMMAPLMVIGTRHT